MTKNELAKNINAEIIDISRTITSDYLLDFTVDEIITTEKAESWTDGGEFKVENPQEFTYIIRCINKCAVHVVDYDNEDETDELGAEDCEYEKEVLIPANTKFKIISAGTEADHDEMGYIIIEVEYIK